MSKLLVLSLGPVQEFISAARRTRDLWAGSTILSAMSRAAAEAVRDGGATLIFPAELGRDEAVANIILARCDGTAADRVEELARTAKERANSVLDGYAEEAREQFDSYIHRTRFNSQIHTGMEFYWASVDEGEGYRPARRQLMNLLRARKACRDFTQFAGEAGVPKSSLDGARETVIGEDRVREAPDGIRLRLRMHEGEQLDAIGLIKRAAVGGQHFPSVPRIAGEPWLRGLKRKHPEKLKKLNSICESMKRENWMQRPNEDKFPRLNDTFPFEGGVMFRGRLADLKREGAPEDDLVQIKQALEELEKVGGEPYPYCGVLVADGDHMGAAIDKIEGAEEHKQFSRNLAGFAGRAEITVKNHFGVPIFAGGDDVLALVPLDTAIECAEALKKDFRDALAGRDGVSLSVGIGIGHNLESLEDLLTYGRDAEKDAKKPDRNALAVHFHPRNGQPVKARRQWGTGIVDDLKRAIRYYLDGEFPDGAAYELRQMARHYKEWKDHPDLPAAMKADARRVLGRKASSETARREIGKLLEGRCGSAEELEAFTNELIVARRLAAAYQQSGRRPGEAV